MIAMEVFVPVICHGELLLAILEKRLKALNTLIACDEFALRNRNLLLETAILLDELSLHNCQLLQVAL